jgi:hypothetical protein
MFSLYIEAMLYKLLRRQLHNGTSGGDDRTKPSMVMLALHDPSGSQTNSGLLYTRYIPSWVLAGQLLQKQHDVHAESLKNSAPSTDAAY